MAHSDAIESQALGLPQKVGTVSAQSAHRVMGPRDRSAPSARPPVMFTSFAQRQEEAHPTRWLLLPTSIHPAQSQREFHRLRGMSLGLFRAKPPWKPSSNKPSDCGRQHSFFSHTSNSDVHASGKLTHKGSKTTQPVL